jgi:hypothetical protein
VVGSAIEVHEGLRTIGRGTAVFRKKRKKGGEPFYNYFEYFWMRRST